MNGTHPKWSWERKRENNKLENIDIAEKLLQIHKKLKAKRQKVSLEAARKGQKGSSASNRKWTAKQCRRNELCSPTNLEWEARNKRN